VLRKRFDKNAPMTLRAIGEEMEPPLCRESIRQIELKALRRLRHPSRRRVLLGEISMPSHKEHIEEEFDKKLLRERMSEELLESNQDVQEIEWSCRTVNGIIDAGIETIGQLAAVRADEFLRVRNVGIKSVLEVRQRLREFAKFQDRRY
jgi:hypothetical protein